LLCNGQGERIRFHAAGGTDRVCGLFLNLDDPAGTQTFIQDGRILRPATDNFGDRRSSFQMRADASNQPAATDGHEDRIEAVASGLSQLSQHFHRDGALSGDDIHVVVGRYVRAAGLLRLATRGLLGKQGFSFHDPHERLHGLNPASPKWINMSGDKYFHGNAEPLPDGGDSQGMIAV
jgi:hypothetical protein